MRKILFVDDEPAVLDGLQDMLYGHLRSWEMTFICGGEAAIAAMNDANYDVIVSDVRMPNVGGVEVLEYAKKFQPQSMRIALTGYSDEQTTIELARLAQRYLRKPCSLEDLDEVILGDFGLLDAFDNPVVKELVGKSGRLPTSENNHMQLLGLLDAQNSSVEEITEVVEQDVALTAKVLQLVNSSFFRRQRFISSASEAVNYLGADTLRSLVLAEQMFDMTKELPTLAGFNPDSLRQHCVLTSTIAKDLVEDSEISMIAFTAGLLHDVGKLLVAREKPELIKALVGGADANSINGWVNADAEREILGCTHAEIGGYFLNLWGLPAPIVEAVTFHGSPADIFTKNFDAIDAVHISNYLAHWVITDSSDDYIESKIDLNYLQDREIQCHLEDWKEKAKDVFNDTFRAD